MAASSPQQPEAALQGTLFGLEPAPPAKELTQGPAGDLEDLVSLDQAALEDDAKRRPRSRALASPETAEDASSETASNDLPPWHHHSLVDPEQLTPMLRHYVELKAAHPERVLLYRLGDFFECFFEDAI